MLQRWPLAILAGILATSPAIYRAAAQSRLDAHRKMTSAFSGVLQNEGPDAAFEVAKKAVVDANKSPPADPRRTDALELMVRAQMARSAWKEVDAIAGEVVRRRRSEVPVEPDLLALALGNRGVIEFALGRAGDADRTFREQLAVYRDAYGPEDVRLAMKLELQAEHIQTPYRRWRAAADLYREALAIRQRTPLGGPQKLAEIHQSLALVTINLGEYAEADEHNREAERLIEAAIAAEPANETLKAGLVQMLAVHAGLEARRGPGHAAATLLARAKAVAPTDRDLAAESKFLIAITEANVAEADGNLDDAIARHLDALETALASRGLADVIPDTLLQLGTLHLRSGNVPAGRDVLQELTEMVGGEAGADAATLFQLAELARLEGRANDQKRLYQMALKSRKQVAAETVVFFGTNRKPETGKPVAAFGNERAAWLSWGEAIVQVPGGEFASEAALKPFQPSPVPVGAATNAAALAITAVSTVNGPRLAALVKNAAPAARLYGGAALVFVHGYNNSFDDAIRRTAQLVRDLNFDGPAFAFAWPSQGSVLRYGTDLERAAATVDACAAFLADVAAATGSAKMHVVAHSMGNRVLLPALRKLPAAVQSRLGEIILAAPAIDMPAFNAAIEGLDPAGTGRFTLYASGRDKALLAGFYREYGTALAGFVSAGEPVVHARIDSIDVSEAGNTAETTNLNHDVFATNPIVTEDMRQLLQLGTRPPGKRLPNMEQRTTRAGAVFWKYRTPDE